MSYKIKFKHQVYTLIVIGNRVTNRHQGVRFLDVLSKQVPKIARDSITTPIVR
jgi:hypothetical protein